MSGTQAGWATKTQGVSCFLAALTAAALACVGLSGCGTNPPQTPPPSRVMVVGGYTFNEPASRREIYFFDAGTGAFEEPPHQMSEGRQCHSATFVNSGVSGFVLVAGGDDANRHASRTAEAIFTDGTNHILASMQTARTQHAATRLLDGRVLITGGANYSGSTKLVLGSAEIFDPASNTFSLTTALGGGDMNDARFGHTATLIEDGPAKGKVLVTGGVEEGRADIAEIFDPATNNFTLTTELGGTKMTFPRAFHTATWLAGINQILITGGVDPSTSHQATARAELFDPATNTFTRIADMKVERYFHTATNIGLNVVLITGGVDSNGNRHILAELFDPLQKSFTLTRHPMTERRTNHSVVPLMSGPLAGQALIVGGAVADDAELYFATQDSFVSVSPLHGEFGSLCQTATLLP
jgi:hypothetical protein